MLMNQTITKLNHMKLFCMVKGLDEQAINPESAALSFEERLSLLTDREWCEREDRRVTRLLRDAGLKVPACLENLDYSAARGLERSIVAGLSGFSWSEQYHNIIICDDLGWVSVYLGTSAHFSAFLTVDLETPRDRAILLIDQPWLMCFLRITSTSDIVRNLFPPQPVIP